MPNAATNPRGFVGTIYVGPLDLFRNLSFGIAGLGGSAQKIGFDTIFVQFAAKMPPGWLQQTAVVSRPQLGRCLFVGHAVAPRPAVDICVGDRSEFWTGLKCCGDVTFALTAAGGRPIVYVREFRGRNYNSDCKTT